MRRSYGGGRNWKTFAFYVRCQLCGKTERIEYSYHTDDQGTRQMFAAKAGWEYEPYQRWYCPEHRRNDVAP